jgi:hypothetical protein
MLLLKRMIRLFIIILALSGNSEALANRHVRFRLRHQRVPDILLTASRPAVVVLLAERPDWHVASPAHELACSWCGLRSNRVNVQFEFFAVGFEWQVVDVVAEGVLDFTTDGGESDDDVGGEDTSGNGDPAEVIPELEGQHHYVDPGDLGNGDGVGDRQGSLEDTVHSGEGFIELDNSGDCESVRSGNAERWKRETYWLGSGRDQFSGFRCQ